MSNKAKKQGGKQEVEQKSVAVAEPTLAQPSSFLLDLFNSAPVYSGVAVTPRSAMRCTPVRCAVLTIAEAIGQLPVHTYKLAADGSRERDTEHVVSQLLDDAANPETPSSELRQQLTQDALLYGNGFAEIVRVDGRPVELWRLDPEAVEVTQDSFRSRVYRLNGTRYISAADMLHIRAPSLDGIIGESPVIQAREAIGLAMTLEQHGARLFGNGARPSGILSIENANDAALAKARAAWQQAHSGSNTGRTAVIPSNANWQPLTLTSVDAQYLELRKFSIEEISRAFRVPPHMLYEMGRATWSNSEQMGAEFLQYTLLPWIKRFEGEIRLKLFGADERETYFAEFLTDDLLRADLSARAEAYSKLIAARVLNPNEARQLENRAPYAGGDAYLNPNVLPNAPQQEGALNG